MQLLNKSLQKLSSSATRISKKDAVIHTKQLMLSNSTCPSCSYTLLRHISLRGIYWRCSHCYQEMPTFST